MLTAGVIGAAVLVLLLLVTLGRGKSKGFVPMSKEQLGQLEDPLLLVVDASSTSQKVVELSFAGGDLKTVGVSSSEEALEFLRLREFAAALVDVHSPPEHGYDLCAEMKRQAPEMPVVLLVGAFEPFDQDRFESSGADKVVKKPFDTTDLRSIVEKLIA